MLRRDLSIVIVNWNSVEFTKDCIGSIQSTVEHLDYEIIVVDNASKDDSVRVLSEAFPWIKLVCSDHNIGFARANNLGVEHSSGVRILFLNPDTRIIKDAVRRMASQLDSEPGIGAVGCRLLNRDMTLQTSCVQAFPTITNQIFGLDWFKRRWPRLPVWGIRALFSENLHGLHEVDAVSGACLMVKRDVFEKVGRFKYRVFHVRGRNGSVLQDPPRGLQGLLCWRCGDCALRWSKREETGKLLCRRIDVAIYLQIPSEVPGNAYAWIYRAALLLSAMARLMILAPLLALPKALIDREPACHAFCKWRKIASWALAIEGWTQELGKTPAPPV